MLGNRKERKVVNWKTILLQWLESHPASTEEIDLIEKKCGIKTLNGIPVLGTRLIKESKDDIKRRRISIFLRKHEITGHLHTIAQRSGDQGMQIEGKVNQQPVSESGEFILLDEEVCLLVDIWRGEFHIIPWEEILYVQA